MGYDVHITRKAFWFDESGPMITQEEWEAYIAGDPELRLDGYAESTTAAGATLRTVDPGIAVWLAHPDVGPNGEGGWIGRHSRGNIVVKSPDQAFLVKMWQIAQVFGARVVGDEDETYGPDGRPDGGYASPPEDYDFGFPELENDSVPDGAAPTQRAPWWHRLFRLGG